jgi:hypothetical protein
MSAGKYLGIAAVAAISACTAAARAGIVFREDFGELADATVPTTSNTAFSYVRLSAGASPTLEVQSPGSFSGSSLLLGATTTSLTGVGMGGGYTPFDVGELSFDVRLPSGLASASVLFFAVGTGTTFTGNSTFSGSQLTAGFQIHQYQLQTRTSANVWADVASVLSPETNYHLDIYFNGSASPYNYGAGSIDPRTADVYLGGVLMGKAVSIRDAVDVTAFRIYSVSAPAGTAYELDNIMLVDYTVPEPSTFILVLSGSALCGARRRLAINCEA